MSNPNDGEAVVPAAPSASSVPVLNWTAVRKAVRCQRDRRDRDDIIEYKRPGECLFVEERLPWLVVEHEAEEGDE